MYTAGRPAGQKRRRRWPWAVLILVLLVGAGGVYELKQHLKPATTITQSKAVTKHVNYAAATKHYDEKDFTIDLPTSWIVKPAPAGPYKTFNWQSTDAKGKPSNQVIQIFEDTIPPNFGVNRVVIVDAAGQQLSIDGEASDNCNTFTKSAAASQRTGVPAKYHDVDFICDQNNLQRDLIGTSSTDGINTVILKSPSTGLAHKFLFSYTDYTINPDYTLFYNALSSFHME